MEVHKVSERFTNPRKSGEKKVMGTDVLDNVESWNFPKYIPELAHEPRHDFFKTFEEEIKDFSEVDL